MIHLHRHLLTLILEKFNFTLNLRYYLSIRTSLLLQSSDLPTKISSLLHLFRCSQLEFLVTTHRWAVVTSSSIAIRLPKLHFTSFKSETSQDQRSFIQLRLILDTVDYLMLLLKVLTLFLSQLLLVVLLLLLYWNMLTHFLLLFLCTDYYPFQNIFFGI